MLINQIKNYLEQTSLEINIYDNLIHIVNYQKIISLTNSKIIVKDNLKKIIITGTSFSLNTLLDSELLVNGKLESLEIKYE